MQNAAIPDQSEHGYVAPDYLQATAALVGRCKARSYQQMRVQTGQRVLDVGCGVGIDVIQLAQLVGAAGMAYGVDADTQMVQQAQLAAASVSNVAFAAGPASALPWGDSSFAAVRSERMFQHLADPEAALLEMLRVSAAGGRVVVLDTDWGSLSINHANPELERRLTAFKASVALRNGYSGRRLFAQMLAAGLHDLSLEVFPIYSTDYATARLACALDDLTTRAQQAGVVTPQEAEDFNAAMHAADAAHGFFACVNMVLVAGTKA